MRASGRTVVLALIVSLAGCYDYVPVTTSPPVGEMVSLEITDRGRVDLSERFGPGLARIEGRLLSVPSNQYVVAVSRVTEISGESAGWTGETVRLDRDVVGRVANRRFAVGRSLLAGGVAVAGVVAFVATRNWISSSSGGSDSTSGRNPASLRIPVGRFVF